MSFGSQKIPWFENNWTFLKDQFLSIFTNNVTFRWKIEHCAGVTKMRSESQRLDKAFAKISLICLKIGGWNFGWAFPVSKNVTTNLLTNKWSCKFLNHRKITRKMQINACFHHCYNKMYVCQQSFQHQVT